LLAGASEAPPEIFALDKEYASLLIRQFDNNDLKFLASVTKPCDQIIQSCFFGTFLQLKDCCRFFSAPEYVFGAVCYRSNPRLLFQVHEAGMFNSFGLSLTMKGSGLAGLNSSIMNGGAALIAGQVSAAVSDRESHTFAVGTRQDRIGVCHKLINSSPLSFP
jgi:hypothetical protein